MKLYIVCLCLVPLVLQSPLSVAQQTEPGLVDISIQVFSHAVATESVPTGDTAPLVVDEGAIRLAESRYVPMLLRYRLEASERFGAVRVLPMLDNGAELMIEGRILESTASHLRLSLSARDSSGRVWIENDYAGTARSSTSLNANALLEDDFQEVYTAIVRDLTAVLDTLDTAALESIRTLALLQYGAALVPHHFAQYVEETPEGRQQIVRLPAQGDPLLRRIEAIREREYLFVDVVDEEYRRFYADIKPVYDMWREYRREQVDSTAAMTAREAETPSAFTRGSYYALQESYNNYRWAKLQDRYLDELREGFTNETAPTELELADSLYRLTGTLEQQYREWRSILAELYELETAQPAP